LQKKYRYFVEKIESDNRRIYIERPGRLNKGCDFVIYVEDLLLFNNSNDKPPKFNDLVTDIKYKKDHLNIMDYNLLIKAITSIYNLNTYLNSYNIIRNIKNIENSWNYELLLKLNRWFFIEQDITYWAKSGREMLYNAILDI
jgi:hypothetical protein